MKQRISRRRMAMWAVALLAAVIFFVLSDAERRKLEGELSAHAAAHEQALSADDLEYAVNVTAGRTYLVFGPAMGKIEVFMRPESGGPITGIAYFYAREDGEWRLRESGACTDAECQIVGQRAFTAAP